MRDNIQSAGHYHNANFDRVIKPLTQSRGLLHHPEWIMTDWLFPSHYTATGQLNKYTDIKHCFEKLFYYLRTVNLWQLVTLICACNSLTIILWQSDRLISIFIYIFFFNKYKQSQEFRKIVCWDWLLVVLPVYMPPLKMYYGDCAQQSLILYSRNVILKCALLVTWTLFNFSENPTKAQASVCEYKTKTCVSSTSWPEIKDVHFK